MHSAIYRGWLDHHRVAPRRHRFRYPLFMAYLDLAELDQVFRGRWWWAATPAVRRPVPFRFDPSDHGGDPQQPLEAWVRTLVAQHTGQRPQGPIRLLTQLRCFGYVFNPVSFYYCFDGSDDSGGALQAVVAEVNNTPWGERHCYVLPQDRPGQPTLQARSAKRLHVSPFHPMALVYDWQFHLPRPATGSPLTVHMTLRETPAGEADPPPVFGATLALRREALNTATLARTLLRFPFMTAQVITAIHWQALRLWLKRVPVHDHPAWQAAQPIVAATAAAEPPVAAAAAATPATPLTVAPEAPERR